MVSTLMATTNPNSSTAIQKMNQMPLSFTKNMGQWDDRVLFRANAGGATMWFTKEGVTYQFTRRMASPVGAALRLPVTVVRMLLQRATARVAPTTRLIDSRKKKIRSSS
jgi:hypothetical protein